MLLFKIKKLFLHFLLVTLLCTFQELIHTMSTCNIINSNGCSSTNNDEAITTAATKRRPIVGYPLVFEDEVEPADGVERRSIGRGYNASTVYRRMSACHHCQSEKLPAKNEAPFHYDYRYPIHMYMYCSGEYP